MIAALKAWMPVVAGFTVVMTALVALADWSRVVYRRYFPYSVTEYTYHINWYGANEQSAGGSIFSTTDGNYDPVAKNVARGDKCERVSASMSAARKPVDGVYQNERTEEINCYEKGHPKNL